MIDRLEQLTGVTQLVVEEKWTGPKYRRRGIDGDEQHVIPRASWHWNGQRFFVFLPVPMYAQRVTLGVWPFEREVVIDQINHLQYAEDLVAAIERSKVEGTDGHRDGGRRRVRAG